jgi:ankyrin repeat protein
LHHAAAFQHHELVVTLLAAGADANVKHIYGRTSLSYSAICSTPNILQLLIDSGGSVNEADDDGETPLIALMYHIGDAAGRLRVLLARPELELDVTFKGKTAEQWAQENGHQDLAQAIAAERARRARWNGLRFAWIAANVTPPI